MYHDTHLQHRKHGSMTSCCRGWSCPPPHMQQSYNTGVHLCPLTTQAGPTHSHKNG